MLKKIKEFLALNALVKKRSVGMQKKIDALLDFNDFGNFHGGHYSFVCCWYFLKRR